MSTKLVCLLDRYFSEDVTPPPGEPVETFFAHPIIKIDIYHDFYMFQAIITVNGTPMLRESMIDDLTAYKNSCSDLNFHGFMLEYALRT